MEATALSFDGALAELVPLVGSKVDVYLGRDESPTCITLAGMRLLACTENHPERMGTAGESWWLALGDGASGISLQRRAFQDAVADEYGGLHLQLDGLAPASAVCNRPSRWRRPAVGISHRTAAVAPCGRLGGSLRSRSRSSRTERAAAS
jgi:hypothetical protein